MAERHQLRYDRTWATKVLASSGRPLRWRCRTCGQRFPSTKAAQGEDCPGRPTQTKPFHPGGQ